MRRAIIPIYFDYASALCYIAWRIVGRLAIELPIDLLWKGVPIAPRLQLSGGDRKPMPSEREKVLLIAAETGVRVAPLERWPDSQAALEGAEAARAAGVFPAYHESVFRAAFEDHGDIGDLALLEEIAARAGMDRLVFRDGLCSRRAASAIAANQAEAQRFSVSGYPAFILGDFPLIGIQPVETMRMLFTRFIELRAQERPN